MSEYIDLCKAAADNAFDNFPISEYQREYDFAKDKYILLLLICCCFLLIDEGKYSTEVANIEQYLSRKKVPFYLVTLAHLVYTHYTDSIDSQFRNRDEIDGFRLREGSNIGEVLLPELQFTLCTYDIIAVNMWDELEHVLSQINK